MQEIDFISVVDLYRLNQLDVYKTKNVTCMRQSFLNTQTICMESE